MRARCVTDPPWSPIVGRLLQKTVAPQLRTLLLPGELRRRMHSRVDAHVGEAIANERMTHFKSPEALALHLRLKTFLAPAQNQSRRVTGAELVEAIEWKYRGLGELIRELRRRSRS